MPMQEHRKNPPKFLPHYLKLNKLIQISKETKYVGISLSMYKLICVLNFLAGPEMWDLIKIVIPKIQSEWEDIAYSMRYDINIVKTIKEDCQNSEKCCKKLFEDWLTTSHGATPKTWFELLNRIKEVDSLKATVAAIEEELKSALC